MESSVSPMFHRNEKKAQAAAIEEAAVSNGMLCTVLSVKVDRSHIWLIGNVARPQLQARMRETIDIEMRLLTIRANDHGALHTTWQQILFPSAHIGYLNLYLPIYVIEKGMVRDLDSGADEKTINVSIRFKRTGESLLPKTLGPHLCNGCADEIGQERLRIVPGAVYCVRCSAIIEKGGKKWQTT